MAREGDVLGDLVHLERDDVGEGAVAAVDGALVERRRDFGERHRLAALAELLGELDVQRDVRHAHAQALEVLDAFHFLLGIEVAEPEREGVHHDQARFFGEALVDQLERLAVHRAVRMIEAVIEHRGLEHGHRREERRGLRARGAHLDDALARLRDVGVFLAELAVGEHAHVVLAVRAFHDVLGKQAHADGFRLAFGFHAGDLDHDLALRLCNAGQGDAAHHGCQCRE